MAAELVKQTYLFRVTPLPEGHPRGGLSPWEGMERAMRIGDQDSQGVTEVSGL